MNSILKNVCKIKVPLKIVEHTHTSCTTIKKERLHIAYKNYHTNLTSSRMLGTEPDQQNSDNTTPICSPRRHFAQKHKSASFLRSGVYEEKQRKRDEVVDEECISPRSDRREKLYCNKSIKFTVKLNDIVKEFNKKNRVLKAHGANKMNTFIFKPSRCKTCSKRTKKLFGEPERMSQKRYFCSTCKRIQFLSNINFSNRIRKNVSYKHRFTPIRFKLEDKSRRFDMKDKGPIKVPLYYLLKKALCTDYPDVIDNISKNVRYQIDTKEAVVGDNQPSLLQKLCSPPVKVAELKTQSEISRRSLSPSPEVTEKIAENKENFEKLKKNEILKTISDILIPLAEKESNQYEEMRKAFVKLQKELERYLVDVKEKKSNDGDIYQLIANLNNLRKNQKQLEIPLYGHDITRPQLPDPPEKQELLSNQCSYQSKLYLSARNPNAKTESSEPQEFQMAILNDKYKGSNYEYPPPSYQGIRNSEKKNVTSKVFSSRGEERCINSRAYTSDTKTTVRQEKPHVDKNVKLNVEKNSRTNRFIKKICQSDADCFQYIQSKAIPRSSMHPPKEQFAVPEPDDGPASVDHPFSLQSKQCIGEANPPLPQVISPPVSGQSGPLGPFSSSSPHSSFNTTDCTSLVEPLVHKPLPPIDPSGIQPDTSTNVESKHILKKVEATLPFSEEANKMENLNRSMKNNVVNLSEEAKHIKFPIEKGFVHRNESSHIFDEPKKVSVVEESKQPKLLRKQSLKTTWKPSKIYKAQSVPDLTSSLVKNKTASDKLECFPNANETHNDLTSTENVKPSSIYKTCKGLFNKICQKFRGHQKRTIASSVSNQRHHPKLRLRRMCGGIVPSETDNHSRRCRRVTFKLKQKYPWNRYSIDKNYSKFDKKQAFLAPNLKSDTKRVYSIKCPNSQLHKKDYSQENTSLTTQKCSKDKYPWNFDETETQENINSCYLTKTSYCNINNINTAEPEVPKVLDSDHPRQSELALILCQKEPEILCGTKRKPLKNISDIKSNTVDKPDTFENICKNDKKSETVTKVSEKSSENVCVSKVERKQPESLGKLCASIPEPNEKMSEQVPNTTKEYSKSTQMSNNESKSDQKMKSSRNLCKKSSGKKPKTKVYTTPKLYRSKLQECKLSKKLLSPRIQHRDKRGKKLGNKCKKKPEPSKVCEKKGEIRKKICDEKPEPPKVCQKKEEDKKEEPPKKVCEKKSEPPNVCHKKEEPLKKICDKKLEPLKVWQKKEENKKQQPPKKVCEKKSEPPKVCDNKEEPFKKPEAPKVCQKKEESPKKQEPLKKICEKKEELVKKVCEQKTDLSKKQSDSSKNSAPKICDQKPEMLKKVCQKKPKAAPETRSQSSKKFPKISAKNLDTPQESATVKKSISAPLIVACANESEKTPPGENGKTKQELSEKTNKDNENESIEKLCKTVKKLNKTAVISKSSKKEPLKIGCINTAKMNKSKEEIKTEERDCNILKSEKKTKPDDSQKTCKTESTEQEKQSECQEIAKEPNCHFCPKLLHSTEEQPKEPKCNFCPTPKKSDDQKSREPMCHLCPEPKESCNDQDPKEPICNFCPIPKNELDDQKQKTESKNQRRKDYTCKFSPKCQEACKEQRSKERSYDVRSKSQDLCKPQDVGKNQGTRKSASSLSSQSQKKTSNSEDEEVLVDAPCFALYERFQHRRKLQQEKNILLNQSKPQDKKTVSPDVEKNSEDNNTKRNTPKKIKTLKIKYISNQDKDQTDNFEHLKKLLEIKEKKNDRVYTISTQKQTQPTSFGNNKQIQNFLTYTKLEQKQTSDPEKKARELANKATGNQTQNKCEKKETTTCKQDKPVCENKEILCNKQEIFAYEKKENKCSDKQASSSSERKCPPSPPKQNCSDSNIKDDPEEKARDLAKKAISKPNNNAAKKKFSSFPDKFGILLKELDIPKSSSSKQKLEASTCYSSADDKRNKKKENSKRKRSDSREKKDEKNDSPCVIPDRKPVYNKKLKKPQMSDYCSKVLIKKEKKNKEDSCEKKEETKEDSCGKKEKQDKKKDSCDEKKCPVPKRSAICDQMVEDFSNKDKKGPKDGNDGGCSSGPTTPKPPSDPPSQSPSCPRSPACPPTCITDSLLTPMCPTKSSSPLGNYEAESVMSITNLVTGEQIVSCKLSINNDVEKKNTEKVSKITEMINGTYKITAWQLPASSDIAKSMKLLTNLDSIAQLPEKQLKAYNPSEKQGQKSSVSTVQTTSKPLETKTSVGKINTSIKKDVNNNKSTILKILDQIVEANEPKSPLPNRETNEKTLKIPQKSNLKGVPLKVQQEYIPKDVIPIKDTPNKQLSVLKQFKPDEQKTSINKSSKLLSQSKNVVIFSEPKDLINILKNSEIQEQKNFLNKFYKLKDTFKPTASLKLQNNVIHAKRSLEELKPRAVELYDDERFVCKIEKLTKAGPAKILRTLTCTRTKDEQGREIFLCKEMKKQANLEQVVTRETSPRKRAETVKSTTEIPVRRMSSQINISHAVSEPDLSNKFAKIRLQPIRLTKKVLERDNKQMEYLIPRSRYEDNETKERIWRIYKTSRKFLNRYYISDNYIARPIVKYKDILLQQKIAQKYDNLETLELRKKD